MNQLENRCPSIFGGLRRSIWMHSRGTTMNLDASCAQRGYVGSGALQRDTAHALDPL